MTGPVPPNQNGGKARPAPESPARRILVINPNTSADMTEDVLAVARTMVHPTTELVARTGHRGVPYIASRAEAAIGAAVVLEILAALDEPIDAAVIAAFGDPGIGAARELMDFPVVGMAEGAMLTACMLGKRFAIVTFSRTLGPWYVDCVEANGLAHRFAGIRLLESPFVSISNVQEEKEAALLDLARAAIEEDEADVLVLGGAPLIGFAERIKDRIDVPVVDGSAAIMQAELLAAIRPRRPHAGAFRPPAGKPSVGLAPALEKLLLRGGNHQA